MYVLCQSKRQKSVSNKVTKLGLSVCNRTTHPQKSVVPLGW